MTPTQARALIVDDSRTVRYQVRRILEEDRELSFLVSEAEDGEVALQLMSGYALNELPDIIILDRNMPNISGDDCIFVLKSDEYWRITPVLFLTAQNEMKEVIRGLSDLKADDYLAKPFDPDELLARIKVLVRIKQAEDVTRTLNASLEHALTAEKKAFQELKAAKIALAESEAVNAMTKVFEKFVPKQFLKRIAKDGIESIRVGNVETEYLTVLFSDIRSFTKLSEQMSADDVFTVLNSYLARMEVSIAEQGGFVDKFIGDAIMALFDGPPAQQIAASIRASIGMLINLAAYNKQRISWSKMPIVAGIGLHYGQVMIGTLGNEQRMDSTVIGDVVNLASRLEGLTKTYHASIIVSEEVFRFVEPGTFLMRELDVVQVKGRDNPIGIYEVMDHYPEEIQARKRALLEPFAQGLSHYRARRWDEGIQAFQRCLTFDETDIISRVFIQRCAQCKAHPPDATWGGEFKMESK